jgi:5-hydroxyisourate hydrolase-like protein (transthyretin family)
MNEEKGMKRHSVFISTCLLATLLFPLVVVLPESATASDVDISETMGLTCGQRIWINVTAGVLVPFTGYLVQLERTSGERDWETVVKVLSNEDGSLSAAFHVPHRNAPGDYTLRLVNKDEQNDVIKTSSLDITNIYYILYQVNGESVDYAVWNKIYVSPQGFTIKVFRWRGTSYELLTTDVAISLFDPSGILRLTDASVAGGVWEIDYVFDFKDGDNYETFYTVVVSQEGKTCAESLLPVKLLVTLDNLSSLTWGDTVYLTGYVKDGKGNGIGGYTVRLYSPGNSFLLLDGTSTFSTGRFLITMSTLKGNAGNWYVGTYMEGDHRIDRKKETLGITDGNARFLWYHRCVVASDDSATLQVQPSELTAGIDQTLELSALWKENPLADAWITMSGIAVSLNGISYQSNEEILLGKTDASGILEVVNLVIKEPGILRFSLTYPFKEEDYAILPDQIPNIRGFIDAEVRSGSAFNVLITNPPSKVMVEEMADVWINASLQPTFIYVFGKTKEDLMGASVRITGCGVNITLDEQHPLSPSAPGLYQVVVSPKTGGILNITVHNSSYGYTFSKDYSISGLQGSVTTSVGYDMSVTPEANETVYVNITNGNYAEVHLSFIDQQWDSAHAKNIASTIGDGTTMGQGRKGHFIFTLNSYDVNEVGYLIVAAKAGIQYLYDIIEVTPLSDLHPYLLLPDEKNRTLTAGVPQDIQVHITNQQGIIVDDVDWVLGSLYDEKGVLYEHIAFTGPQGNFVWSLKGWSPIVPGEFIITTANNTGGNEHRGSLVLEVKRATIECHPARLTAGIELTNIKVDVSAWDANGYPLPAATRLYPEKDMDDTILTLEHESFFLLDEQGQGWFTISYLGDTPGDITFCLQSSCTTQGSLTISFPSVLVDPEELYVGITNEIAITAYDVEGIPISDLYLCLVGSSSGILQAQPDPSLTNEQGKAVLSVVPAASGSLHVSIVHNLRYINGILHWDDLVLMEPVVFVVGLKPLVLGLSHARIYEGDTLMITVTSSSQPVDDVAVSLGNSSKETDGYGHVSFIAPNPGVDTLLYTITAEKRGYQIVKDAVTVLKRYPILILGPPTKVAPGSEFTVTVVAKGTVLAGAQVSFRTQTAISDANGKALFIAPSQNGTYQLMAWCEGFHDGIFNVTVDTSTALVPGFHVGITFLALVIVGCIVVLMKQRRRGGG